MDDEINKTEFCSGQEKKAGCGKVKTPGPKRRANNACTKRPSCAVDAGSSKAELFSQHAKAGTMDTSIKSEELWPTRMHHTPAPPPAWTMAGRMLNYAPSTPSSRLMMKN